MKMHWLVAGAVVAIVSGVFIMKHITENKEKMLNHLDNPENRNYAETPLANYESEFEGTEILI